MTTVWFSIVISLQIGGGPFFNGYFSVVKTNPTDTTGLVNHFYDATNCSADIYINNGYNDADSIFDLSNNTFSFDGTNITSLPGLNDGTFYSLYYDNEEDQGFIDSLDNIGNVLFTKDVIYNINVTDPFVCPAVNKIVKFFSQTVGSASIPIKQNHPNNLSSAKMGMPFKPDQMTQGNALSIGRMAYNKGVNRNVDDIGKGAQHKKKWYGASSSRMSSEHTNLRTIEATGKGTTNQINPQTFSFSGPDQTSQKTALARCRGNGCVSPKKKGAK